MAWKIDNPTNLRIDVWVIQFSKIEAKSNQWFIYAEFHLSIIYVYILSLEHVIMKFIKMYNFKKKF